MGPETLPISCCPSPEWRAVELQTWKRTAYRSLNVLVVPDSEEWSDDAECVAGGVRAVWRCESCGSIFGAGVASAHVYEETINTGRVLR
jgi:hypothetical protein